MNIQEQLQKFADANISLFDASEAFLKELGVRYNRGDVESISLNDIAPDMNFPNSVQEALKLLTAAYFVGDVNEKTFSTTAQFNADLQEHLTDAKDEHYKGMFVFAVDLQANVKLTRTFAATLTRAFNRVAKQQPVVLFIRQGDKLSIATCERTPYKQEWLEGEKLGKVSVLMNVDCKIPHRGHINIIETMRPANCNCFDKLYEQWKKVFSSDILTEKFYKELYSWYRWAVDKNSGITFPNKVSTIEDDRDNINVKIIRLITRLLFVWFIKEKKLVPTDLFDVEKLNNILVDFDSKSGSDGKYYNAILQNLFFATLNNPIELRDFVQAEEYKGRSKEYGVKTLLRDDKKQSWFKVTHSEVISKYFHRIPNMNCGLFECLDKYSKCDIDTPEDMFLDGFSTKGTIKDGHYDRRAFIPNIFFFADENTEVTISKEEKQNETEIIKVSGLIRILDKYKFTVEENTPADAQVSLDPELLGKVFENLLASFNPETQTTARKASGSYYTPRPIVEYMVNESLVEYLKTKVGADKEDSWRKLIGYDDAPCELNEEDRKQVLESLLNCKVLDPACGSGAFPMGMLQQMVHIINKIDKDNKLWEEIVIAHTEKEMAQAIRKEDEKERNERIDDIKKTFNEFKASPDYTRKLYIIENCIFGSDIQPIAMLISKLRFFISLICEQKDDQIHIDEEHVACNYGINTLPNLETKFVAANSLLKANIRDCEEDWTIDPHLIQLKNDLLEIRHRHFLAKTQKEKLTLRRADEKKREEIEKYILKTTAQPNQILIQQLEARIKLLEKDKELYKGDKFVEQLVNAQYEAFNDEEQGATQMVNVNERKRKEIDSQIKKCKQAIQKEQNKANQESFVNAVSQITKWNPYSQLEFAPFFDPDWMFGIKDGFDVVIGNPPYVKISKDNPFVRYFKKQFEVGMCGRSNLYKIFVVQGFYLLNEGGVFSYIMPNSYLADDSILLRDFLLESRIIEIVEYTETDKVFKNVAQAVTTIVVSNSEPNAKHECRIRTAKQGENVVEQALFYQNDGHCFIPMSKLIEKLQKQNHSLSEWFTAYQGEINLTTKAQYYSSKNIANAFPMWRGDNVGKYKPSSPPCEYCVKSATSRTDWDLPRIVIKQVTNQQTSFRTSAFISPKNYLCGNSTNYLIPKENNISLEAFVGLINSKVFNYLFSYFSFTNHITTKELYAVKIPSKDDIMNTSIEELVKNRISESDSCLINKLESEIDMLVYFLYRLSYAEVKIIDPDIEKIISEEDYNKRLESNE